MLSAPQSPAPPRCALPAQAIAARPAFYNLSMFLQSVLSLPSGVGYSRSISAFLSILSGLLVDKMDNCAGSGVYGLSGVSAAQ